MVAGAFGDLYRIPAADLLHPDVEFPAPIRSVGDIPAIGGPRRIHLQALVKGQPSESALKVRGLASGPPLPHGEPREGSEENARATQRQNHEPSPGVRRGLFRALGLHWGIGRLYGRSRFLDTGNRA